MSAAEGIACLLGITITDSLLNAVHIYWSHQALQEEVVLGGEVEVSEQSLVCIGKVAAAVAR
jgi:hypothetical protein